jgi:hypothetical protein
MGRFDVTEDQYMLFLRFDVLTAASMKMFVFWVVAPCSLVEVHRPDDGGSKNL